MSQRLGLIFIADFAHLPYNVVSVGDKQAPDMVDEVVIGTAILQKAFLEADTAFHALPDVTSIKGI